MDGTPFGRYRLVELLGRGDYLYQVRSNVTRRGAVLVPMVSAFLDHVQPATLDLFWASQAQRERDLEPCVTCP